MSTAAPASGLAAYTTERVVARASAWPSRLPAVGGRARLLAIDGGRAGKPRLVARPGARRAGPAGRAGGYAGGRVAGG